MSPALPRPTRILRERDVKAYCKRQVFANGWEWRAVKWIGRKHAPDNLIMAPGMAVFPEFKRPKGKARAGQEREHARMRKSGLFVVVLQSYADVDALVLHISPRSIEDLEMVIGTSKEIGQRIFEIDRRDAGIAYDNLLDEARRATKWVDERKKKAKEDNTADVTPEE